MAYSGSEASTNNPSLKPDGNPNLTPDQKLLEQARKSLKQCIDNEESERGKMLDDLRFCTLDQWPADIRKDREGDLESGPRPCLTIDKINQYIVQTVNDLRQGKPGINVRPQDDAADIETAKILKGLIRNIEDQSNADIAYATGAENSVKIGLGFWRVVTEYVSEDSFDQDIFIRPIPNTFSTYLSRHVNPDGSDAKEGFIIESYDLDRFRQEYPKAKYQQDEFDNLGHDLAYWHTGERVTVVEYYCLERTKQTIHFLADGTTISEDDYSSWPQSQGVKPTVQDSRTTFKEQLKWYKMTGVEILERRDLPGKYIPIVEVIGRESQIEGKRILWGLVRPAKDSLRMYNYWASTITEKMALAPKTPWVAAEGQIAGREAEWRDSNRKNRAVLQYKPIDIQGNALPAPKRQEGMPIESAMIEQLKIIEHDVQTSLGMFKAAVGETESQQSGRAILALQRESDTGTFHFGANQGVSIRHTGRIILDLIPHYYDTKRIVRILGDDGEVKTAQLDPEQEQAHLKQPVDNGYRSIYNPSVGKYDVSISVGPSYTTKRLEATATFVEMAKGAADPASAAILRYLVMRNSDASGADEAAKLLKTMLPPQALQALSTNEPIPPQVQAQMQQMGQKMQMMAEQGKKLQEENVQLKAGAQVKAASVQADAQLKSQELSQAQEQARKDAEFQVWKAKLDAATKIEVAEIASKTTLAEAGLKAETDANLELSKDLKTDPESGETGEGQPMTIPTPEKPVRPLDRLASLHQQGMTQHAQSMGQLGEVLGKLSDSMSQMVVLQQQTLAALERPKSVAIGSVQKDSEGNVIGATVKTSIIPAKRLN